MPIVYRTEEVIDQKATGKKNAEFRLMHHVRQVALAKALGVWSTNLSNLERGEGNGRWNEAFVKAYEKAVRSLSKQRKP